MQGRLLLLHIKLTFNLFLQVASKRMGRGDFILKISTRLLVDARVPSTIAGRINVDLDREITSCDSCHVPLNLLDFAALEQVAQGNGE